MSLSALEHSVSCFPKCSGHFLQISGMRFEFDPRNQPRITWVSVGGRPLQMAKEYTAAVPLFLAIGNDGFSTLNKLHQKNTSMHPKDLKTTD